MAALTLTRLVAGPWSFRESEGRVVSKHPHHLTGMHRASVEVVEAHGL